MNDRSQKVELKEFDFEFENEQNSLNVKNEY